MQTALFWIAWGFISFWSLKTFYYAFAKKKLDRLRKATFGINLAVLVLTFLPWLPLDLGGKSGLTLALEGNLPALFVTLLVGSLLLLLLKDNALLKLGVLATIVNTFFLFIIMYQLRPGTFTLTLYDTAPIVAVLLLLVACVAGLLLWQQLELKEKRKR